MRELTKCFKALANERRLRVLKELYYREPLTINTIAKRIKLSLKSTSKHMQKLSDCDLIERSNNSLQVWCRINRKHPLVRSIIAHLK